MGRGRTAPLTRDGTRIVLESRTWMARYCDAQGRLQEVSTHCRDEQTARYVLAQLGRKVEHVRAGIMTPQQARTANHAYVPVSEHVDAYLEHLKAKTVRGRRVSKKHQVNVKRQLRRFVEDHGCIRLADISRESMERWTSRAGRLWHWRAHAQYLSGRDHALLQLVRGDGPPGRQPLERPVQGRCPQRPAADASGR